MVEAMIRVFSASLNPEKKWFVLTNSLCGCTPKKFSQSDLFEKFRDEIAIRPASELRDENGAQIHSILKDSGIRFQGSKVFVGTVFAILWET